MRACIPLMLLVLHLGACASESDQASQVSSSANTNARKGPACADASLDTDRWARLTARDGDVSIRLPGDSSAIASRIAESGAEVWQADGLSLSYRVSSAVSDSIAPSNNLRDFATCTATIGGHSVEIVSYYSEKTVLPGQFVLARWRRSDGQEVRLEAHGASTASRDTLLAIVRAVEARPAG